MRDLLGGLAAGLIGLVAVGALGFGAQYLSHSSAEFFSPWQEEIRRKTHVESKVYTDASTMRFYDLQRQYYAATSDDEKRTIIAMVRHEASTFPVDRLPDDLRTFVELAR